MAVYRVPSNRYRRSRTSGTTTHHDTIEMYRGDALMKQNASALKLKKIIVSQRFFQSFRTTGFGKKVKTSMTSVSHNELSTPAHDECPSTNRRLVLVRTRRNDVMTTLCAYTLRRYVARPLRGPPSHGDARWAHKTAPSRRRAVGGFLFIYGIKQRRRRPHLEFSRAEYGK